MNSEEKRLIIVDMYNSLVQWVMNNMSYREGVIIEAPYLETVEDGSKAYFSAELRYLISMLLTEYYSTENLDKWNEFKSLLMSKLKNELDISLDDHHTTSVISKRWATSWFLRCMESEEDMKKKSNTK